MVAVWQINYLLVFFFDGLLSIYILYLIYQSVFKYRVFGLSLNLLIGLEMGIFALLIAYSLNFNAEEILLYKTQLTSA